MISFLTLSTLYFIVTSELGEKGNKAVEIIFGGALDGPPEVEDGPADLSKRLLSQTGHRRPEVHVGEDAGLHAQVGLVPSVGLHTHNWPCHNPLDLAW